MKKRYVPLAVVIAVVSAAACSSDKPAASSSSTTTAVTTTAVSSSTEATTSSTGAAITECKLDKPVKIGYAADFNVGAVSDTPASNMAKYEIGLFNKAGGIGGQPAEIVVKQISQDPQDLAAAQRSVQEMIDSGVNFILGPPFADYGTAILEVTKGKVPVIFVTSTEVTLTDPTKGSFLASFNDKVQASAAAEFSIKQGFKTGVTLSSSDAPYFNVTTAAFADVYKKAGGTLVKDLAFKFGDTDFSAQVNEIAAMSPRPDVIYSAFFLPDAGIFLKQLRAAGVKSAVIGADGFDATLIWTAGADAEGVYFTAHAFPGPKNDLASLLDGYTKSGAEKIESQSFGALGADAAIIAKAAIEKACSTDPAKVIDALNNLESVKVSSGTVTYKGAGGTPKKDVYIMQVKGGAPVVADAFYPSVVSKG